MKHIFYGVSVACLLLALWIVVVSARANIWQFATFIDLVLLIALAIAAFASARNLCD